MVIKMNFRKCCLAQENECWFKTKPQKKKKKKKKMYDSCSQNKTKTGKQEKKKA